MHSICVFCGSRPGTSSDYVAVGRQFGAQLASRGVRCVYGGGRVGMMGAVADGCLEAGGEVVGVIPDFLMKAEVAHPGVDAMHVVDSMHARKWRMAELSDAFVTLPGGVGTLEELFEVYSWSYLDLHRKPVAVLNVDRYFDTLLAFVDEMVDRGFVAPSVRDALIVSDEVEALLAQVADAWSGGDASGGAGLDRV